MLAKAAVRTTLPETRPARQSEKSQSRARCAARLAVVTDRRLSNGAARLYVLLDDYAGMRAECWPHQRTAAERIGRSVRSVKRWIAELVGAGYIAIRRTQTGNRYLLSWATVPESNALLRFGPSEVTARARQYIEPDQELTVSNSNRVGSPSSSEWGFGLDDAVGLFNWASSLP